MPQDNPNQNGSEANKYAELSRWCIGEADNYLRRRNNMQASEKGWGATAHALKAIAEERGWNHNSHGLIVDIAKQVADEQGRADLLPLFGVARRCTSISTKTGFHRNLLERGKETAAGTGAHSHRPAAPGFRARGSVKVAG